MVPMIISLIVLVVVTVQVFYTFTTNDKNGIKRCKWRIAFGVIIIAL